jgi:hypothetical protein
MDDGGGRQRRAGDNARRVRGARAEQGVRQGRSAAAPLRTRPPPRMPRRDGCADGRGRRRAPPHHARRRATFCLRDQPRRVMARSRGARATGRSGCCGFPQATWASSVASGAASRRARSTSRSCGSKRGGRPGERPGARVAPVRAVPSQRLMLDRRTAKVAAAARRDIPCWTAATTRLRRSSAYARIPTVDHRSTYLGTAINAQSPSQSAGAF